jgi:hypothetical protein
MLEDGENTEHKTLSLEMSLKIEHRFEKPVELRGFEPLTFCMPCRRATSCAIAPQPTNPAASYRSTPRGGTQLAYRFRARVSYADATRPRGDTAEASRPRLTLSSYADSRDH